VRKCRRCRQAAIPLAAIWADARRETNIGRNLLADKKNKKNAWIIENVKK
jgi:hypothetical protein